MSKIFKGINRVEVNYGTWNYARTNGTIHNGIDIDTTDSDINIYCPVEKAYVYKAEYRNDSSNKLGNYVGLYIGQSNGTLKEGTLRMLLGHNSKNVATVGTVVYEGDKLAVMGKSGNAIGDPQAEHVHCQVDKMNGRNWQNIDPTPYCDMPNKVGEFSGRLMNELVTVQTWVKNQYVSSLVADGIAGAATKTAIAKAAQQELNRQWGANLVCDGIFGNASKNAWKYGVKQGDQGNITKIIQGRLITIGYSLDFDGIFGARTKSAVVNFQQIRGLYADGIVGAAPAYALFA